MYITWNGLLYFLKDIFLKIFVCIYLAALGLTGGMQTLSCGTWDPAPDQALNAGPLRWKCGVLVTGPPGKDQKYDFLTDFFPNCFSFEWMQGGVGRVIMYCAKSSSREVKSETAERDPKIFNSIKS